MGRTPPPKRIQEYVAKCKKKELKGPIDAHFENVGADIVLSSYREIVKEWTLKKFSDRKPDPLSKDRVDPLF